MSQDSPATQVSASSSTEGNEAPRNNLFPFSTFPFSTHLSCQQCCVLLQPKNRGLGGTQGSCSSLEHSADMDTPRHPTANVPCPGGVTAVPQRSACSCCRTGKTGAGKGGKNKGLWIKARSSSTQREEEEKRSESPMPCYLEELVAPEPSLLQNHLDGTLAVCDNASAGCHSQQQRVPPVSMSRCPLPCFHLSFRCPGFARAWQSSKPVTEGGMGMVCARQHRDRALATINL